MSHTFCVFDTEREASKILPLLGHLVANPRRPLDGYRPKIDRSQQFNENSPISDKFEYDVVSQKSPTKTIKAARAAKAKAGLGTIFGLDFGTDKNSTYVVSADELKTYTLHQVNDAWETVEEEFEKHLKNFVETQEGKAYFMVSLVTATNPYIERGDAHGRSGGVRIGLPLAAVTAGAVPLSILDPSVGGEIDISDSTTNKGKLEGVYALAAEYRVVALASDYELSLKKLFSRKQLLKVRGPFESKRGGLAFGDDDDDSGEEDDEGGKFM
jgi:hypothetical protein